MKFYSLGNPTDTASFQEAVERGIASGGSLYFPEVIPTIPRSKLARLAGASRQEVARTVLGAWLSDELAPAELDAIIAQASTFDVPLVPVGNKLILEVFHGPTAAFKDVAARYLAAFMGYYSQKTQRSRIVLVATSGDTGGAIAQGFADVPGTTVVVLFPRGRVSQLQREQLTRVASNVSTLEVGGTFDDCQDLVKRALGDPRLAGLGLTSANSISMGRLLPQMTYYATGALAGHGLDRRLRFVVPSGNLGNLTAGALARAMGLPIHSFLAACNVNDLLHRYLLSADAQARTVTATFANAMDVGRPNNLPRLIQVFGGDHAKLTATITGATITDRVIRTTIQQVWREHGYLLDPHTAVAWAAGDANPAEGVADVIVATASPQKFAREIEAKCGIPVANSRLLDTLRERPARVKAATTNYHEFRRFLLNLPH